MTFEERAREAGERLGEWTPPETASDVAVGRARRRRRRRQGALGAAAVVLLATSAVVLWAGDDGQRVIASGTTTTSTGSSCERDVGAAAVYLNPDDDPAAVAAVGERIDGDDRVESSRFVDHQESYDLYRKVYADRPDMLAAVLPADLPTSYRVVLQDPAAVEAFVTDLRTVPGVYEAVGAPCEAPDDLTLVAPATTATTAPVPGVAAPDIDFEVTVTSDCADFERAPGSEREACPPPTDVRGVDSAYVRAAGADPADPGTLEPSARDRVYTPGRYDVTLFAGLVDWGCAANAALRIEVAGDGDDRVVTVLSVDGDPEFRGAHPTIRLTMPATSTECTGGMTSGSGTSVRVDLGARLTVRCPPTANCVPADGLPALTLTDLRLLTSAGTVLAGGVSSTTWFLEPGEYLLVVTATQPDATWCDHSRYVGTFDLAVGTDGALSLRLVEPDTGRRLEEVGTAPPPPSTPTLVPDRLDATLALTAQPC